MTEVQLRKAGERYTAARKHRDDLIRASTLPLRTIAEAVGMSHENVRQIKNRVK